MKIYTTTVLGFIIWMIVLSVLSTAFYFSHKAIQKYAVSDPNIKIDNTTNSTLTIPWIVLVFISISHCAGFFYNNVSTLSLWIEGSVLLYFFIAGIIWRPNLPKYAYILGFYVPFGILCMVMIWNTYLLTTNVDRMERLARTLYLSVDKLYEISSRKVSKCLRRKTYQIQPEIYGIVARRNGRINLFSFNK
jgi:hypothetical protein